MVCHFTLNFFGFVSNDASCKFCQILCETFGVFRILPLLLEWLTSIKNIPIDVGLMMYYCLPSVKLFELKNFKKKFNIVNNFLF